MLIDFFLKLKAGGVPVSIKEFLTLLEALRKRVDRGSIDEFYYLARACLVKDEKHFDNFDRVFAAYFKGIIELPTASSCADPRGVAAGSSAEMHPHRRGEKADRVARRLGKAHGDAEASGSRSRRAATRAATSGSAPPARRPFGAYGYNPEGVRIGQDESRNRSAVKVWDQREYRNLDDTVELGTRNIKVALRRLRSSRAKAPRRSSTSTTPSARPRSNAGWLDIKMVPERHNAVKVLLFLDVGGSMDDHIERLRGAVLRRAHRVQAPRVLLLPQLPLRARVEGQPPPRTPSASPRGT